MMMMAIVMVVMLSTLANENEKTGRKNQADFAWRIDSDAGRRRWFRCSSDGGDESCCFAAAAFVSPK